MILRLILRNVLRRPLRSLLTMGSLVVALFLLCTLRSLVTTLELGTELSKANRLIVQSAVSLFVNLPVSYLPKIKAVDGVERAANWNWFGGYYQEERNQFAQFACDIDVALEIYPELVIAEGELADVMANRRACVVSRTLAERFGWKMGETVPLVGMIYAHPDGPDAPWEFVVGAIYEPTDPAYGEMMLMHWDYFEETMEATSMGNPGVSTFAVEVSQGADVTAVMGAIDRLFENGPQRVQATTESEFNRQFATMFGNVPFFVSSIGGAICVAILLACLNTMLMAAREQRIDVGIMKALGFTDLRMLLLLGVQSLVLVGIGGVLGVLLAIGAEGPIGEVMASFWPGYRVESETITLGLLVTLGIGLVSGIAPAWTASRLRCVEALRPT